MLLFIYLFTCESRTKVHNNRMNKNKIYALLQA